MQIEEVKNKLNEIVNSMSHKLTAEEKHFVRQCAKELGIEFEPKNTRCQSCYFDAAILCLKELRTREAIKETETDGRRFVLRPGVDVYFGNIRVNNETLTDELAERIINRGFERKFFIKCE